MIHVVCGSCGLRVIVPDTVQGRQGVCFGCGAPVRVPVTEHRPAEQVINFEPGTRRSAKARWK